MDATMKCTQRLPCWTSQKTNPCMDDKDQKRQAAGPAGDRTSLRDKQIPLCSTGDFKERQQSYNLRRAHSHTAAGTKKIVEPSFRHCFRRHLYMPQNPWSPPECRLRFPLNHRCIPAPKLSPSFVEFPDHWTVLISIFAGILGFWPHLAGISNGQ